MSKSYLPIFFHADIIDAIHDLISKDIRVGEIAIADNGSIGVVVSDIYGNPLSNDTKVKIKLTLEPLMLGNCEKTFGKNGIAKIHPVDGFDP